MSRTSDNESESSLPPHTLPIFPSSPPPIPTQLSNTTEMGTEPVPKSEPPLTQEAQLVRPEIRRTHSEETERPSSAQRTKDEVDEKEDAAIKEQSEDEDEDEERGPAEKIVDFDWEGLHSRYHEAMKICHSEEDELMREWESLMAYFRIWAASGHEHETDRTYSRLCTRSTYVQNEEAELEQKRNHYVNVVKAFESAIYLSHHSPQTEVSQLLSGSDILSTFPRRLMRSSSVPTCTSSRLHSMRCSIM